MVHYHCVAVGCKNDSRKKGRLHKYPDMIDKNGNAVEFFPLPSAVKYPKERKAWINSVRRADFNPGPQEYWHSICSKHFVDHKPTKENPVPTLFSYNNYKIKQQRTTKNSNVPLRNQDQSINRYRYKI